MVAVGLCVGVGLVGLKVVGVNVGIFVGGADGLLGLAVGFADGLRVGAAVCATCISPIINIATKLIIEREIFMAEKLGMNFGKLGLLRQFANKTGRRRERSAEWNECILIY